MKEFYIVILIIIITPLAYLLGYNNGQVDLYCNGPEEDKVTKTLTIPFGDMPSYKYVRLVHESENYSADHDITLTLDDLWKLCYYYKHYPQGLEIFLINSEPSQEIKRTLSEEISQLERKKIKLEKELGR